MTEPTKCKECGCTHLYWHEGALVCWRCGLVNATEDGANVPQFDGGDVRAWLRGDPVQQLEMTL
jgi:hypothetical protein